MAELIFIGNNFPYQSGTFMSNIYGIDGRRWDWGKIQIALAQGEIITIRPATPAELAPYEAEIATYHQRDKEITP